MAEAGAEDVKFSAGFFDVASSQPANTEEEGGGKSRDKNHKSGHSFCEKRRGSFNGVVESVQPAFLENLTQLEEVDLKLRD